MIHAVIVILKLPMCQASSSDGGKVLTLGNKNALHHHENTRRTLNIILHSLYYLMIIIIIKTDLVLRVLN